MWVLLQFADAAPRGVDIIPASFGPQDISLLRKKVVADLMGQVII